MPSKLCFTQCRWSVLRYTPVQNINRVDLAGLAPGMATVFLWGGGVAICLRGRTRNSCNHAPRDPHAAGFV